VTVTELSPVARDQQIEAAEATFAELPRGSLLLGYQQRTLSQLMAGVSLLVIEKSRRIGLTWAIAAYFVLVAAAQRSAGGDNCWYMGYDMEMAREFIDACAMWARSFGIAAEDADEELLDGDGEKVQAFRIRFASGFKIVALPSVPRALRGKQGKVGIDEAAFHKNIGETLKSALALLMWGGQVIVWSTHDGVANPFNILLDEIKAGERKGAYLRIDFDSAITDGLYERIALSARVKGRTILPKDEWIADIFATYGEDADEELRCIPKSGSGSLIKPEDIAACEHPEAGKPEHYSGGLTYIGRDVARRRDAAVIHGFELVGDVLWLRDRYEEVGTSFADQDAFFDDLFLTRRIAYAGIDQTGMGEKVVEDAQRRHGSSRVNGVQLTGPNRLDLAISLQQRFERGLIRIPPDPILRADVRAIKRAGTATGGIRIVNDDTMHADRFWAMALASRGADKPFQDFAYAGHQRAVDERRRQNGEAFFFDDDDDAPRGHGRFGGGAW
jgi:phage FluMu gp28-like protein